MKDVGYQALVNHHGEVWRDKARTWYQSGSKRPPNITRVTGWPKLLALHTQEKKSAHHEGLQRE